MVAQGRFYCTHSHLGVTVNENLSWDDHVSKLYTDCARRIGILRRLRNKLNSTAFRKIFIGAIRPKIEYACEMWSGGPTGKIAKLQDAYCRRHQIHLPPLKKRFEYHTLTLFFSRLNIKWCRSTCPLLCLLLRQNQVNIVSENFPTLFLWFRKHQH